MDLTASSAVNLPITSASLRLVVVWMGVRSIRCTNSGAWVPPRFTLTTNLVVFISLNVLGEKDSGEPRSHASVHFLEVEYTTAVKGLPHSKQLALSRDVINPQDGHIRCVPYSAIRGLSLRIQWSSR